jgi:AraC-like DNA-binding protein
MHIQFFKPVSKLLAPYLEGYYFLQHSATEPPASYLTFPNNFAILSVCENAGIELDKPLARISETKTGMLSELICHFKEPVRISYEGNISEITFYFKPLGLNTFLPQPLSAYTADYFSTFMPYDNYKSAMLAILREPDRDKQCAAIEDYWISKFLGFEHPFLRSLLQDLQSKDETRTIAELARSYGTSRQHIHRQFELHLAKTPSEFKKVQRFRDALIQSIELKQRGENLTALSYDALFYDQSHLIRDFKALTGRTPKKFFEQISFQEEARVNWLYLH